MLREVNMYITPIVAVLCAFYLCMKQVFKYELWLCDLKFLVTVRVKKKFCLLIVSTLLVLLK